VEGGRAQVRTFAAAAVAGAMAGAVAAAVAAAVAVGGAVAAAGMRTPSVAAAD